jgi:hypothetical protein
MLDTFYLLKDDLIVFTFDAEQSSFILKWKSYLIIIALLNLHKEVLNSREKKIQINHCYFIAVIL